MPFGRPSRGLKGALGKPPKASKSLRETSGIPGEAFGVTREGKSNGDNLFPQQLQLHLHVKEKLFSVRAPQLGGNTAVNENIFNVTPVDSNWPRST